MSAPDAPRVKSPKVTEYPTISNAPLVGLLEGNGAFSNIHLAVLVLFVPWLLKRMLPLVNRGGFKTYLFLLLLTGLPTTLAYWMVMSRISTTAGVFGDRRTNRVDLPANVEANEYFEIKDAELKKHYPAGTKIPMQVFHDSYFEGKLDIKGDVLKTLEHRHLFVSFTMTWALLRYVLTTLIPDVILHTSEQDSDQVTDHYDRGNDFYSWFLGPRMIYTSGVVLDAARQETLEELQDNKLAIVCNKLNLQPWDRLLDIGCGWGTLTAYAAKNFGCDATGVTLAKNQTEFGNQRIKDNGLLEAQARILCMDFREIAQTKPKGTYTKIVSLEMAEHVGIRRYQTFLRQVYDLLDEDGIFVFQVAGLRQCWQYEDLNWGLFMNKYVFPGADASCTLGWVINQLERANFEVKSVDVLGVHYSATIYRWYLNWVDNREKVVAAYGERWYRVWVFFLAWSVISSRQGSASVFQLTLHKNINAYHRIDGVKNHGGIHVKLEKEPQLIL
ncbi:sphingolipid C9-methyltransferase [Rhodocollybia butyracea]|uniref:sphingolipid C(9)-methyltransferase n=1 Tax=Rhodocollybia butyracea TaxID=206335 RepID=A0A9P5UD20_9AGAR|nr:sphingolipid C9-methyltransferase [Rhodocollybia butyracea]